MHNAKQLDYAIHQMILEGKTAEDVFRTLRSDLRVRALTGNASNSDFQKMLTKAAEDTLDTIKEADRRGPLVRSHLRIVHAVTGLVGDVIEALSMVDIGDSPKDIRDGIQLLQMLEQKPNEKVLQEAIDWLKEAVDDSVKHTEFQERYNDLFPTEAALE